MVDERKELAERIAAGSAGWLQNLAAKGQANLFGEDTARTVIADVIAAQNKWRVVRSVRPTNWPDTDKARVDLALLPWRADSDSWYGVIELKWPGESSDWDQQRSLIVQDIVRIVSVATIPFNAAFLVLGGTNAAIASLFDKRHERAALRENRRLAFNQLLTRDPNNVGGLTSEELDRYFPNHRDRLPANDFTFNKIQLRLFGQSQAFIGNEWQGGVFVWQCNRSRGPKKVPASAPPIVTPSTGSPPAGATSA